MRAYAPLLILAAVLAAFLALDIAAPLLRPFGTVLGLDGSAGIIDHPDLWTDMDPLSKTAYWLGDLLCHQDEDRTFILNGNEMPLCIRDISLIAGFAIGMALSYSLWQRSVTITKTWMALCIVAILMTPGEWLLENVSDADLPALRVIASIATGIGGSLLLPCLLTRMLPARAAWSSAHGRTMDTRLFVPHVCNGTAIRSHRWQPS